MVANAYHLMFANVLRNIEAITVNTAYRLAMSLVPISMVTTSVHMTVIWPNVFSTVPIFPA